jgi:hypothetical protein
MDLEQWLAIPEFPNYLVSDWGRVYDIQKKRLVPYALLKLQEGATTTSYLTVQLTNADGRTWRVVHRLVAKAFVPGFEPGGLVAHLDGDTFYNNASNLAWTSDT